MAYGKGESNVGSSVNTYKAPFMGFEVRDRGRGNRGSGKLATLTIEGICVQDRKKELGARREGGDAQGNWDELRRRPRRTKFVRIPMESPSKL